MIKGLKIIAIGSGVALMFFIMLIIYVVVISGDSQRVITDHPMIGQSFSAGDRVFYMEGCNAIESCAEAPREREVGRALECGQLNSTVTPLYKNAYEISQKTTFDLVELVTVKSRGFNAIGGGGYVLAVLRDNDGLLSTFLFSSLGGTDKPFGFKGGSICDG